MMCFLGVSRMQAIMLVESVDGEHALLGRPRSLRRRGPVLTCLSGFIEQGESIEEAVSRSSLARPGNARCTTMQPPSQLQLNSGHPAPAPPALHCKMSARGPQRLHT